MDESDIEQAQEQESDLISVSSGSSTPIPPANNEYLMRPPAGTTGQKKRKRGKNASEELLHIVAEKISNMTEDQPEDEFSSYGKVVVAELRGMSQMQRRITQKIINDALFLGGMNIIEPSAYIVNGPKNIQYPSVD